MPGLESAASAVFAEHQGYHRGGAVVCAEMDTDCLCPDGPLPVGSLNKKCHNTYAEKTVWLRGEDRKHGLPYRAENAWRKFEEIAG
jgi:hypothetical protein